MKKIDNHDIKNVVGSSNLFDDEQHYRDWEKYFQSIFPTYEEFLEKMQEAYDNLPSVSIN